MMIGRVPFRTIAMIALMGGTAAAAGDAVQVNGFGGQLHHQIDSSPITTTAQPYCNQERLGERIRVLRDRKAELIDEIGRKEAELVGREMSASERAKRKAELQGFIDALVAVLGVIPASSPDDPMDAEFVALVRELAKVEKQLAAIMQHIQKCKDGETGGGDRIQILRPF